MVKKLELNPRGQVAPTGASHQLPPNKLRGRVAPQSPLEESATTEASRMWHENERVGFSIPCKSTLFECYFSEIVDEFLLKLVQKAACKKLDRHADTQTDRIEPILSSSEDMFWTVKTQIPVAKASKSCPQNDLLIPANIPVKEHLRLASVVALSSSGACGANIGSHFWLNHLEDIRSVNVNILH